MANKLLVTDEGLALACTIHTANLPQHTLMKITGDATVDKAGADAIVIGRQTKGTKAADGSGTIETPFKELISIKADGVLAAGDDVKMSSDDGGGLQRVTKWVSQTDAAPGDKPQTLYGVVWVGGADGSTVQILVYG
jgi:hypothetical protein